MNWLKKKKILKTLFNQTCVFYKAGKRWHFETDIKNEDSELIKAYINEVENERKGGR